MKARLERKTAREKGLIVSFGFNQYFMEMSRLVTQRFHGDIDSFFVLSAVCVASVGHIMTDPANLDRYQSLDDHIEEDYAYIRLLPLAEITGMPRTTVRRKVARLMDLGYVEHNRARGYRIIKGAMAKCPHLHKIMQAQVALMVRLFNTMLGGEMIALQPVRRGLKESSRPSAGP